MERLGNGKRNAHSPQKKFSSTPSPVAVDRGSGRVVCPAFSFPDRRVDGQAFARSPCGSRDRAESRISVSRDDASISRDERLDASISRKWAERAEIPPRVIEIYHLWSEFTIYGRDRPDMGEIRQIWARFARYGRDSPFVTENSYPNTTTSLYS